MDSHNGLDAPEEFIALELILQIYRYESCLPVVAVNDIRLEINHWKHRKHSLVEEGEFLDIVSRISVWIEALEVFEIVDEIIGDARVFILHHANILFAH